MNLTQLYQNKLENSTTYNKDVENNITTLIDDFGPIVTKLVNHSNVANDQKTQFQSDTNKTQTLIAIILYGIIIFCLFMGICGMCSVIFSDCFKFCLKKMKQRRNAISNTVYDTVSEDINYDSEPSSNHSNVKKIYDKNLKLQETQLDEIVIHTGREEIKCVICLEKIYLSDQSKNKLVQLNCHHIYHRDCISSWYFKGATSCPVCRTEIENLVEQHE
jgi:hypothetical protein